MPKPVDLLQGTLDLLILKAVSLGPLHGYGVLLRLHQLTANRFQIQQGSLYPALYRLEHQGLIAGEWGASDNNRRARFYTLTPAGRRQLQKEARQWHEQADIITAVLKAHGRSGVPLYLYYAPGAAEAQVLPQILTPGLVVEAVSTPAPRSST